MFPEKEDEDGFFYSKEVNKSTYLELSVDEPINFNFFNEIDSNSQMNE